MSGKTTVYEDIKQLLKRRIADGRLTVGDRLPSEYQLVEELHVNRNRARQALRELEIEGFIVRKRGSGSYVAAPPGQAAAVRTIGQSTVALVFPRYISRYARQVVEGFMQHMAAEKQQIVAYNVQPDPASEPAYLRSIAESGVSGLTVWVNNDTPELRSLLLELREKRFPVVLTDRYFEGLDIDHVTSANEEIGYLLTRALVERGHRRIAFAGYRKPASSIIDRFRGYCRALREAGIDEPSPPLGDEDGGLVMLDENLDKQPRDAVRTVMSLRDRPTAFTCIHDREAEVVCAELRHMGYSVAEDVEFAAVDDEHGPEPHPFAGTWVAQQAHEVGAQTAEVLCMRIANPDAPVHRRQIPPGPLVRKEQGT